MSLDVEFERPCVNAGQYQAIVITTDPKALVAYHAIYADGTNAKDANYYGGNDGGQVDESGSWRDEWVVKPGAPEGTVRVDVIGQTDSDTGYTQGEFTVRHGSCAQG